MNEQCPQIQCCGVWTDYPMPGQPTECPTCHSTFHTAEETWEEQPSTWISVDWEQALLDAIAVDRIFDRD